MPPDERKPAPPPGSPANAAPAPPPFPPPGGLDLSEDACAPADELTEDDVNALVDEARRRVAAQAMRFMTLGAILAIGGAVVTFGMGALRGYLLSLPIGATITGIGLFGYGLVRHFKPQSDDVDRQIERMVDEQRQQPAIIQHVQFGATAIRDGVEHFGDWSALMLREFEDDVKPNLKRLHQASQRLAAVEPSQWDEQAPQIVAEVFGAAPAKSTT